MFSLAVGAKTRLTEISPRLSDIGYGSCAADQQYSAGNHKRAEPIGELCVLQIHPWPAQRRSLDAAAINPNSGGWLCSTDSILVIPAPNVLTPLRGMGGQF